MTKDQQTILVRKLLKDDHYLELRRKIFHLGFGLAWFLVLSTLEQVLAIYLLILTVIFGLILSFVTTHYHVPFFTPMLRIFDRPEDLESLPGKGALTFTLGVLLAVMFFPKHAYLLGVLVLTVADFSATIVGFYVGKMPIPFVEGRTLEGSAAFFMVTMVTLLLAGCSLDKTVAISMLATLMELIGKKIDDNLTIPFTVAAGMVFI